MLSGEISTIPSEFTNDDIVARSMVGILVSVKTAFDALGACTRYSCLCELGNTSAALLCVATSIPAESKKVIVQSDGEIVQSPARGIYFVTNAGSGSDIVIAIGHCRV